VGRATQHVWAARLQSVSRLGSESREEDSSQTTDQTHYTVHTGAFWTVLPKN
jgi:hypothetical protein